jgi:hypothetical protein
MDELKEAIKAINIGKSEDIYGLSIENIIYAGEEFLHHLLDLINNIVAQDSIPELVKVGLLSPIYKNKGDKNDSKNYRGIVVLPIICKLLEHIARTNFRVDGCMSNRCNFLIKMAMSTTSNADLASSNAM